MKISEARNLLSAIVTVQNSPAARKVKFAYALARNKKILTPIEESVSEVEAQLAENEVVKAFEEDRIRLLTEAAEKDSMGRPVIENNQFKLTDPDALARISEELLEKHPKASDEMAAHNAKIEELIQKDEEVNLYKIPLEDFPDEISDLPPYIMDMLMLIVKDED